MADVVVLTAFNGVGLPRTARVLGRGAQAAGLSVAVRDHGDPPEPARLAVVFVERIAAAWSDAAPARLLVPNQEWFGPSQQALLADHVDVVLAKTRYAARLFAGLGCRTAHIGFTSEDVLDPAVLRDPLSCLHVAGRSLQKGTGPVLDAWRRHTEWPPLTVVQHPETPLRVDAPNVRPVSAYLDDAEMRALQNRHVVHVVPSEAEGWGHSIVEAMSCGAVVVTTDAPPMDELVRPDRGVPVTAPRRQHQGVGENAHVDSAGLERAVQDVVDMGPAGRRRLGQRARAWFVENDAGFRSRLPSALLATVDAASPGRPAGATAPGA